MIRAFRASAKRLGGLNPVAPLQVQYSKTGNAVDVLKLGPAEPISEGNMGANGVHVQMIAAPINPADINLAEGVYGIKVPLPAIAGNEGVGRITKLGKNVKQFRVGDWVIPSEAAFGTWRTEAIIPEDKLIRVPDDLPAAYAATLSVNPATAYRMLRDFEQLNPGDVIIQNGANSMVGLCVIQMAREMGVKTINIVRSDRPNVEETLQLLNNLGGDINVPDEYVNTPGFNEIIADLPPIKLGLNCVGGDQTTHLVRTLGDKATLVTYGGMSKRPINVPFETLVYKQLRMKGFWVSEWYKKHNQLDRSVMMSEICNMIRTDKLALFHEVHDFDDFEHALKRSQEPFQFRKVVLNMDYPDRFAEHDAKTNEQYEFFETSVV